MTTDIDTVLEEVATQAGLDDFGHPSFRDGLQRFLRSATTEAELNPVGRASVQGTVRSSLTTRLKVTDWHRRHPALGRAPMPSPIFIVGLPRTGTTALSHLLARDPANRSLLMWEGTNPVPPPTAAGYATDPRFERSKAQGMQLYELKPELKAMHYDPPDAPVECSVLLGQHFTSLSMSTLYNIPSYDEWLLGPEQDFSHAYAYHRQVLQILQSDVPGRWQLKHPGHCLAMDTIRATYPDARFVMTHRDPVKSLASVCSLVRAISGVFSDADHSAYIARHWTDLLVAMLEAVLDYRDHQGDQAFYDMGYRDLVSDPVGQVRAIYEKFGIELSEQAERQMAQWALEHGQGEHGHHSYSLEDFRLERGPLDERFGRYLRRFDVAKETV